MREQIDNHRLLDPLDRLLVEASGRDRRTLVSVTAEVEIEDPAGAVFASRLAGDRWFCWEQPEQGFTIAALGSAYEIASTERQPSPPLSASGREGSPSMRRR